MNTDLSEVYQQLCSKNNIPVSELITSCLNDASANGELSLKQTTVSNTCCSLIAKTLQRVRTIRVLDLADCLLPFDGLKYFLDVVNELENLTVLNLKGNRIGNKITLYVSKIISINRSITELRLDWNNIGDSADTFAQLCNSLLSNPVLITLNLSNNNLCQESSFHLAKLLNTNMYLKNIDLSWNDMGEAGAALLLKSLKNNNTLIVLNIQGNHVTVETAEMISEQLKQNKANKIHQKIIEYKNLGLLEHVALADKNYEIQMTSLHRQYQNNIIELQSKLYFLQIENQEKKQELDEIKNNSIKEKESNAELLNKVEKVKSELSFQKENFNSLIKKISSDMSSSDVEIMESLEDFEKVIYIIKRIKKICTSKIKKETTANKRLLEEASPKLTNELNALKLELKNLKYSTDIEIRNYIDELKTTKELLNNKINNEVDKTHLIEKQFMNTSDEMTAMLVASNNKIKDIDAEKKDLQIKLAKLEAKATVDIQTMQELQKSLNLAKEELNAFNKNHLSNIAAQNLKSKLSSDTFNREIDVLKFRLNEKQKELKFCEMEKMEKNVNHKTEVSMLEQQLHFEKLNFIKKRKENLKLIEELNFTFTQHIDKLGKENMDVSSHEKS